MSEDKASFDYKSDSDAESSNSRESISWTASEFIEHNRGKTWYLLLVVSTFGLAVLVYFLTKDMFGALIIVVLGMIVASIAHRKPRQIGYGLSSRGIVIGDKNYSYKEFKSFAIVRDGALTSLVLVPLKKFAAPISVFFDPDDEKKIISILGDHLPLEQRSADHIDSLSRKLRF